MKCAVSRRGVREGRSRGLMPELRPEYWKDSWEKNIPGSGDSRHSGLQVCLELGVKPPDWPRARWLVMFSTFSLLPVGIHALWKQCLFWSSAHFLIYIYFGGLGLF